MGFVADSLDTLTFSFVYGTGLLLVIALAFVAYWFSKFPEAVTETVNLCTSKEQHDDVP